MIGSLPQTPIEWAQKACDSLMDTYQAGELPPAHRWHYHQGVFLCGMELLWKTLREDRYIHYIQQYVDDLVDEQGNFDFARDELDAVQAGLLLFTLYERTSKRKYREAAFKLRHLLLTLNRTSEGGYWHKDKYPHQMWLDGLYMAGVFSLKYANTYRDDALRAEVLHQERLMRKYMKDEATGLLYHAWDESRRMPWSNPATGCSPEFWSRSLGWYGLAVSQFMDELPETDPGRAELAAELNGFVQALIRYQDPQSGLWYQVVDKGHEPDNWLETSGSCLFVYTIARAVKLGILPAEIADEAAEAARKGYEGLIQVLQWDEQGRLLLPDICIGTSAGDYRNYVTRPKVSNDLHGVGALVMACVEMQDLYPA
ncbi:glycoside hydrolase family 88/105 protein [Paenibacillus silagei]|uniref:Unsaturated rhamnogalacturonyl hydrolase n=1 Tax=Paenibacillus silagei TaxID=1670801 RepID=A0ABS4P0T9_9BACL|nr:glycoside hydrolase family 88 protein [Paenibacillus silagei]MBP2115922.1 unsaturated rhamnogalacturonyl hydrolase [Paenibacillus silagei]